jgi:hypothetical protein
MEPSEIAMLQQAVYRLENLGTESLARLSRLEENLHLFRHELAGNGQPGRIARLETAVTGLRAQYHQQRGIWAAISFLISLGVAMAARLFHK